MSRTYKPWIGNCLLKLQSYSERLWKLKCEIISETLSVQPDVGVYDPYPVNDYHSN